MDIQNTFKYEKDLRGEYKIYTGKINDKHYLYTDGLSFVMFKTEKEAQEFGSQLDCLREYLPRTIFGEYLVRLNTIIKKGD